MSAYCGSTGIYSSRSTCTEASPGLGKLLEKNGFHALVLVKLKVIFDGSSNGWIFAQTWCTMKRRNILIHGFDYHLEKVPVNQFSRDVILKSPKASLFYEKINFAYNFLVSSFTILKFSRINYYYIKMFWMLLLHEISFRGLNGIKFIFFWLVVWGIWSQVTNFFVC